MAYRIFLSIYHFTDYTLFMIKKIIADLPQTVKSVQFINTEFVLFLLYFSNIHINSTHTHTTPRKSVILPAIN